MIDYRNYHTSPLYIPSIPAEEETKFEGLSFKTTRNTYHPYHFHDGVEMMYVHKGAILVNAFNLVETVKEGQFIAHDPYCIHSVESIMPDTVVTTIHIDEEYIDENDGLLSSNVHMVADTKEYLRLKNEVFEWIKMSVMPDATTEKMLRQMKKIFPDVQKVISVAFLNTKEDITTVQGSDKDHERLTSVFNYLFYHHDETIGLDTISAELYVSKYYLSHYMKRTFGYTMKQALSYCRSEESVIDLLGSEMTIAEVAAKHGFSSVRSYNETFPRYYGVSPAKYRRRNLKESVAYKDFEEEEVDLEDLSLEAGEGNMAQSGRGYSVVVNLPEGSYEILSVETGNNNVSNRMAKLNGKNKTINLDSNCDELILRIRKKQ